jgi:phosphoglycolate phosphatase-like HAD superfamily hydrolase
VATGGHSTQELADSSADVVFDDLTDTRRFLDLLDRDFREERPRCR